MSEPDQTNGAMQIDDFCLEVALVLRRILDLAELPDRDGDGSDVEREESGDDSARGSGETAG